MRTFPSIAAAADDVYLAFTRFVHVSRGDEQKLTTSSPAPSCNSGPGHAGRSRLRAPLFEIQTHLDRTIPGHIQRRRRHAHHRRHRRQWSGMGDLFHPVCRQLGVVREVSLDGWHNFHRDTCHHRSGPRSLAGRHHRCARQGLGGMAGLPQRQPTDSSLRTVRRRILAGNHCFLRHPAGQQWGSSHFRSGIYMMGDICTTSPPPTFSVGLQGTSNFAQVQIIPSPDHQRGNVAYSPFLAPSPTVSFSWQDAAAVQGTTSYYYVHGVQVTNSYWKQGEGSLGKPHVDFVSIGSRFSV